jgi:hypothetical protein
MNHLFGRQLICFNEAIHPLPYANERPLKKGSNIFAKGFTPVWRWLSDNY